MEDDTMGSKTANNEDWVFSAETKHCETGEVAFCVVVISVEDRAEITNIGDWLQQFVEATQTVPMRFTINDMTGAEIASGQAEVSE